MKIHYSLPVKLLALLLLLVLLTGAGLSLFTVILCVDVGAYESGGDFFDSILAYRTCRDYGYDLNNILQQYATNEKVTVSSQEYLDQMREQFSAQNTNLRVMFESEDANTLLSLDGLLGINSGRSAAGSERLVATFAYEIPVSGGILGQWIDLDRRLLELEAMQGAASETDADWPYGEAYDAANYYYAGDGTESPYLHTYITMYFYVDSALPVFDKFHEANYWYRTLKDAAYPMLGLFAACALLGLLDWIYLMCAAGRRPNTDKGVVTLRFIDRIPYDLFLAPCILAFALLTVVLGEMVFGRPGFDLELYFIVLISSVFAAALLFTILTLTTAARWKSKTLLRNTVIWRICAWLWRGLSGGAGMVAGKLQSRERPTPEESQRLEQRRQEQRSQTINRVGKGARAACGAVGGLFSRAGRKCQDSFAVVPMVWKGILLLLAIAFVNLFLFILALNNDFFLLVLMAFDMAVLWGYLSILRQMVWLHTGANKIASGELDYRIPPDMMHWEFKAHAEALNTIRDGIDAAVEERVKAVEERTKSERMRSELLTNVSHDIKTPLTSIISYVGLLQKEEVGSEKAREYVEVLGRQSDRLKKLLEDLLEASKASTGNIAVNAAPTSVGELLRQVAGEYAEKLAGAGIEPIITLPAQDAMIYADGRLLWRVFDNLMANIVKYAMPQTRVYLDLHSDASVTAVAVKNVSRERLNIAADELMERFVRGDTSRSTEGSGLGLSIAQSLTELMGGTFELVIDGDLFKVQISFPTLHDSPPSAPQEPKAAKGSAALRATIQAAAPLAETSPEGTAGTASPLFSAKKYTLRMAMDAKAAAEQAEAAEAMAGAAEAAETEAGEMETVESEAAEGEADAAEAAETEAVETEADATEAAEADEAERSHDTQ